MRVVNTDYNQFAIVFFKKVQKKQGYFKTTLYGGSFLCDLRDPSPPSPPGPLQFSSEPLQGSREGGPSADPQ